MKIFSDIGKMLGGRTRTRTLDPLIKSNRIAFTMRSSEKRCYND